MKHTEDTRTERINNLKSLLDITEKNKETSKINWKKYLKKLKKDIIEKDKEEKGKQKVIFMKISLLLEHIGMIHFLESLMDKKYNWQIHLQNWLHMIPKAVNVYYNHISNEICFLLEFCDFFLILNTLLQSLMYIHIKTILVFYIFGQLLALSDEYA